MIHKMTQDKSPVLRERHHWPNFEILANSFLAVALDGNRWQKDLGQQGQLLPGRSLGSGFRL
jgi:hypothetical protein